MIEFATLEANGFKGFYARSEREAHKCLILVVGEEGNGYIERCAAKYFNSRGINVLLLGMHQKSSEVPGLRRFDLGVIEAAIEWLRERGEEKVGILGASMGAQVALAAAERMPQLSLVIGFAPIDYVTEGYYQGNKRGMKEWPAGCSALSYEGEELFYQPYYLKEEEFWKLYYENTMRQRELTSGAIFEHSEKHTRVPEKCFIKTEAIAGKLLLFAAEDDSMWNSALYCKRIAKRRRAQDKEDLTEIHVYPYGTHLLYPQGLIVQMLSVFSGIVDKPYRSGRKNSRRCKEARMDVEEKLWKAIRAW
ncbi:MAG: hypothetical protein K6G23_00690 [Lachnospiraceae bacterium]|nr:hypothetical protein [Lachnospiraceae bacterium]